MKTLVVYYSRTGNTKKVAKIIADKLKADLDEIIDLKNRSGILGFIFAGRDAVKKNLTKIAFTKNPADYDLVIIGTPVWATTATPAVRTYLSQNKKSLNTVAFFTTSGGDSPRKTVAFLEKLLERKAMASAGWTTNELKNNTLEPKLDNFLKNFLNHLH